ncbi:MAG: hypothetical protein CMQ34_10900 [Gammaproteobacteria bacterium]|nr:hypothetical protein [Gammaproteobacteria bacterium]|tara:strand:- start:1378 stop:2445 length:1068 start_codon:yes stop_codon:yes gene_type:complete
MPASLKRLQLDRRGDSNMQSGTISPQTSTSLASGDTCVLVADIGGTNARLALTHGDGVLANSITLPCREYAQIDAAIDAYLQTCAAYQTPQQMVLAVAAATDQDEVILTNNHWQFSQRALAHKYAMPVMAINDFTAQAWCLPGLREADVRWLQQVTGNNLDWSQGNRSIAGPGTGFGAATMTLTREIIESEPGQCAFAPLTPRQLAILVHLWDSHPRVTADHLLSGPGLSNIHSAIYVLQTGKTSPAVTPAALVEAARNGDQLARQSMEEFSRILGAVCGDLALSMGSLGGFFLSGNILQKLDELFDHDLFMTAFTDKGRFSNWCQRVPVGLLNITDPGLQGCAAFSQRQAGQAR